VAYSYKQLLTSDLEPLKQLLKVFGQAFNDSATYQGNIPNDSYLKSLVSKLDFIALAALDGNEVVGGLVAYELEKFEQQRKEIFIYDLAVAEQHRRKGIATGLINELKSLTKKRGACLIFVQVDKTDEPAIKLYKSLGTKQSTYNFDIPV
jgi:aminoglycoside 3-N-acetyltransferase I